MPQTYTIRRMSRADVERMIDWAAAEGWNPGLHDITPFHVTDPAGFFVGLLDGEPVASISVVRYPDNFAFLGFYIVRPDARGFGFGTRLWQAGMAYLEGYVVGLDGVPAQQANYRLSQFAHAWPNRRFRGIVDGYPDPAFVDAHEVPLDLLLTFDRTMFPAPRPAFLSAWFAMPDSRTLALLDDGTVRALGTIRRCREGFKVGPLFAPDRGIAERMLRALACIAHGEPVFIDVPVANDDAVDMAEEMQLRSCFETARMYRGPAPELPLHRCFGITTFELG